MKDRFEVETIEITPAGQEVIQPSPTPVNWIANIARFPDPIKGTSVHLVCLDAYHQLGFLRAFLEAGAARALASYIDAAADLAENRGISVVEGAQAHQFNRAARRAAERGNGHG